MTAETSTARTTGPNAAPCDRTVELRRTVRFCIPLGPRGLPAGESVAQAAHNTFAASPATAGPAAYFEMDVACRGVVDPTTGYLASIADIDAAVRERIVPWLDAEVRKDEPQSPPSLLRAAVQLLQAALDDRLHSVIWRLTPFLSVMIEVETMDRFVLRQQFSFAASHRLHVPTLDEAENRRIFGKCNNAHGHGHNYRLEVAVSAAIRMPPTPPTPPAPPAIDGPRLDRIVDEAVVRRFDHTHLNLDTAEFADLIPSVENIARVCHGLLERPVADAGARLETVTVWETEKTCCVYPAP